MHIPDGMLAPSVVAVTDAASVGVLGYAVSWVRRNFEQKRVILMAVMSALIFALQMLNFPVAGGTSGHFAGGAAAAILLGPWPASIVMTTVLFVQALMFADGGVVALGANILNLAIVGPLVGYLVWRAAKPKSVASGGRTATAAFAAAWFAVVVSALLAAGEIWLSGRARLGLIMGAMLFWHALIGVGEGLITAGLVAYVLRVRPDLAGESGDSARSSFRPVALILGAVALIAAGLSFLASKYPDGLEASYFRDASAESFTRASAHGPFAGYTIAGMGNESIAGVLAGIVGLTLAGLLVYSLATVALRRKGGSQAARVDDGLHGHVHEHPAEPAHAHPHHHVQTRDKAPLAPPHSHAHPLSFERYTYLISPVHRLDPRVKIISAAILVLSIVLTPPASAVEFAALIALLAAVTLLARLPLKAVLARSALVLPIAAGIALFAPLATVGGGLARHTVAAAYVSGWPVAWGIVSKAWLSAYLITILAATTPTPKLLRALHSLRVPDVFLTLLAFLYRYAEALGEEVVTIRRAIGSRAPELKGMRLVRLYGNLAGNMFVRAYERGERIHSAMVSRGFDGTLPLAESLALRPADAVPLLIALLAAVAVVLY